MHEDSDTIIALTLGDLAWEALINASRQDPERDRRPRTDAEDYECGWAACDCLPPF